MYFTQNRQEDAGPFRFRTVAGGLSRLNAYTEGRAGTVGWEACYRLNKLGGGGRGSGNRDAGGPHATTVNPTTHVAVFSERSGVRRR